MERTSLSESLDVNVVRGAQTLESCGAQGTYHVVCKDSHGITKWEETIDNLVVTVGRDYVLNTAFRGSAADSSWYLGLLTSATTPDVAHTMSSFPATLTESTATGTRNLLSFGAPAAGTGNARKVTATATTFTATGTVTVTGCFLCTDSSGTSGTLYSAALFSSSKALSLNDQITVTYSTEV